MQTLITVLIVVAAAAYLAWQYVPASWFGGKKADGGACDDCEGCNAP